MEFKDFALSTSRKLWILIDHFQPAKRFSSSWTLCFLQCQTSFFLFFSHFFLPIVPILVHVHKIVQKIAGCWLANAMGFSRRGIEIWEPESKILTLWLHDYWTQISSKTSIHFSFFVISRRDFLQNKKEEDSPADMVGSYECHHQIWLAGFISKYENPVKLRSIRMQTKVLELSWIHVIKIFGMCWFLLCSGVPSHSWSHKCSKWIKNKNLPKIIIMNFSLMWRMQTLQHRWAMQLHLWAQKWKLTFIPQTTLEMKNCLRTFQLFFF